MPKRSKHFEKFIEWFNDQKVGEKISTNGNKIRSIFYRVRNKPTYSDISGWLTALQKHGCIKSTGLFVNKSILREKVRNYIPGKKVDSYGKKQTNNVSKSLIQVPKDHYERLTKTIIDLTKITKLQQDEIKKLKETTIDPSWLEPMLDSLMKETGLQI